VALKFFNDLKDKQTALEAKITKLENDICKHDSFEIRLEELESKITNNNEKVEQPHEISVPGVTSRKQITSPKPVSTLDKKFNIIIYGLTEPPANTNRQGRIRHDLDCLMRLFSELKLNITHDSIKDFHRLGKFDQQNMRLPSNYCEILEGF